MPSLLAVDMGLRTGLAAFSRDGRLKWYRSSNFGSRRRLRNGAASILRDHPSLTHLVLEGGGDLAASWESATRRAEIHYMRVDAHTWREALLLPRDRRTGASAKLNADRLARRFIEWSGAPRPTSLRHDAAEAILTGIWAVRTLNWLGEMPDEVLAGR